MARKKKPVDDTPICDRAYVRRIDPLWTRGRVPNCFWQDETGSTWMAVHQALTKGVRGLPGGSSLAKLLRQHGLKQPLGKPSRIR